MNDTHETEVAHRPPRLSIQARGVLEALARSRDGQLPVGDVLARVRQPSTSFPVARASLSRTLRRLWTAGLVELVTHHPNRPALSDDVAYWRAVYDRVRAAPAASYQTYRAQLAARGQPEDRYGSVAAFLEAYRTVAVRPPARVRGVQLTPAGRASVNNRIERRVE